MVSKWLCRLALLLVGLLVVGQALATPLNDAYRYEDGFVDNIGIDINSTGFVNFGGIQTAKNLSNELISRCFQLPPAGGGTFTGWSFAEFAVDNLDLVFINRLHIESCDGNTNYTTFNPSVGTTAVDMAPLVPVSASSIRFRWQVVYWFFGGSRTASISNWRALGTSTDATLLSITPSTATSDSNSDVSFSLGLSSNAATRNPVLEVDLNAINGTPNVGSAGLGLATDATVCYDVDNDGVAGVPLTECQRYRPLEFLSASNGTAGEPPDLSDLTQPSQNPATGGLTDGIIRWQLQDLPDAYSGSISVNLHIPKGYIDGKSIALSAKLSFGETSLDGLLNNFQEVAETSPQVLINSEHAGLIRSWSPYGNLGPGAQNIQDTYYIRNSVNQENSPSDHENVTLTFLAPAASTCVPTFRSTLASARYNWPIAVDSPAVGSSLDSNPVTVNLFRVSYVNDSTSGRVRLRYDIPNDCADGSVAMSRAISSGANPAITNTATRNHNILFNACRSGYNHMHRAQSGLLVENDYRPHPAWSEYYINRGSVRPGEFISTWSPYGDSTYRTQTVVLEKSYAVINIPTATTFHGYRTRSKEDTDSKIYFFKDPTGTAPTPDQAAFDNSFDPANQSPAAGWYRVQRTWDGPFTDFTGTVADNTNEAAVVGPGAKILVVKTNDNTSFGATDYGLLRTQAVWRVCDGSYGCAQSPENTLVRVTGNTYSYQQVQAPFSRSCASITGHSTYVGGFSYPKVYTEAVQNNVQAGNVASVILTPHNSNLGSEFVDGHWSFDLSSIASSIDLTNVTGEVLSTNLNLPKPDQNIQGQSCDVSDIVFTAPTVTNPIAYWDIPDRCQIPNGWGKRISNINSQDNYVPAYQLKLNVPIKTTTLAGTVLDFTGQIRTKDLSSVGADNAVVTSRWSASNYQDVSSVVVLENPSVLVTKSAPSGWPINSTFSYSLVLENRGNTPLFGYFIIDELPRTGTNGSEFDPEYGKVFVGAVAADALIETSTDAQCNSSPETVAWINQSLVATARAGYLSETAVVDPGTICFRMRRSTSGPALPPQESINIAIDVTIPNDLFLSGKSLQNKAIVGVSDEFGGSSNTASSESALVSTIVDGAVVLGATKTTTASLDKPDQVGWLLGYSNESGTDAFNVTVSDNLPAEVIYQGLAQTLPAGVTCKHGSAGDINSDGVDDCALINTNTDGGGGTLELVVDTLTLDDGNPSAGDDQGVVGIWTSMNSSSDIENCVYSIPPAGVSGSACVNGQLSTMSFTKTQLVAGGRTGVVPTVYFGESIDYTLLIQNNGSTAQFVRVKDELPTQVSYVSGSLIIDGANASDSLINGGILDYTSILALAPGSQIQISFTATVDNLNDGLLISNAATGALCADRTTLDSCSGARQSDLVQAQIEGSRIEGLVFTDNGDGSAIAHNGLLEGAELPLANKTVSLIHVASNQQVATTVTNTDGIFALHGNLTAGDDYRIELYHPGDWVAVSHHKGNTQAQESIPTTTELTFTVHSAATAYTGIRFGLVELPELVVSQSVNADAGQSVVLPHTYSVTTQGLLQFDLSTAQALWSASGWQASLYHDVDCNQQHTGADPEVTGVIAVDPDINAEICVLFVLTVPGQVAQTVSMEIPLLTSLALSDTAATGHDVILSTEVVDFLTIEVTGTGNLLLTKLVGNVSRSESVTMLNQALPGEILRYEIEFVVDGGGSISDVYIIDNTPAFTVLDQPVTCPTTFPECIVIIPASGNNAGGYSGEIKWKIADDLPAGTIGKVSFDVKIE